MDDLPFYRFQMLVDTWIAEIEEEKKQKKQQDEQQKKEQQRYSKMFNPGSLTRNSGMPKMPKM